MSDSLAYEVSKLVFGTQDANRNFFKKSDFISSVLWPKKIHHQIIRIEFCAQANEKVKKRALYCHAYVLLQCIRDGVFVQNVKNVHFSNI